MYLQLQPLTVFGAEALRPVALIHVPLGIEKQSWSINWNQQVPKIHEDFELRFCFWLIST